MTSTGYCRDQDAVVCQVAYDRQDRKDTDDHGKLELYLQPDVEPMEGVQYWCDVVEVAGAGHNACCTVLSGASSADHRRCRVGLHVQQAVAAVQATVN